MLTFKQYNNKLLNEQNIVNTHSTHIEELIFDNHERGVKRAVEGLQYIVDTIGTSNNALSTKIDGAPAIFIIVDVDGNIGVATKSIFNKTPKVNWTNSDIDNNHSGGLADSLKVALKYLPKIIKDRKPVIYQGDLLYTTKSLSKTTINDQKCWLFHPNTIAYTIEVDSDLGKQIANSEIGIAMHTKYKWDGVDYKTINVEQFGISKKLFKDDKNVFVIDTVSFNNNNNVGFTDQQKSLIDKSLKTIDALSKTIDWSIFDQQIIQYRLSIMINKFVRDNIAMPKPKQRAEQFAQYLEQYVIDEVNDRKSERGKNALIDKYQPVIDYLNQKSTINNLSNIFEIFDTITEIKLLIIEKLNEITMFNNFIIKSNGDFVHSGDEGFVLVSTSAKGAKLVDRYKFSANNFSKDIIHGFEKDNR